jgi:hypothetical protein
MLKKAAVVSPPTRCETRRSRGKATAMNGRSEKEKVKCNGKRGQLRRYDPLDFSLLTFPFSLFTASENAAGGLFQHPAKNGSWKSQFSSIVAMAAGLRTGLQRANVPLTQRVTAPHSSC